MRILVRIAIVGVVLLTVGLGALVVALPRIAGSEAVRARLQEAARDATGQEVSWKELSFGLLPPRLVVMAPEVKEPGPSGKALVEAEQVDLRLAVLPLLARTVVIDSLQVEGVTVRLVRTQDGIRLPGQKQPAPGGAQAPSAPSAEGAGVALAVRELDVRRSRLILEDRTVAPPVTWDLTDLEARARGSSLDRPLDVNLSAGLASGGRVQVNGTVKLDGEIDLAAKLDGLVLAPVAPYLGKGRSVLGALTGTLKARGAAASPQALTADLTLADGDVRLEDVGLRGRVSLKAELQGGLETPTGSFEVDATQASLAYGQAFTKPSGTPATLSGRLVPQAGGGIGVDQVRLKVRNLDATGRLGFGDRTRVELDAPPFDLAGWGELLPALASVRPQGRVSLEKLAVATPPLDVRGRIGLADLRLAFQEGQPIVVNGSLEGAGSALRGPGLALTVAGQPVKLDLDLADLAGTPRYRVQVAAEQADANALVTALAGKKDLLQGPLTFRANLTGPTGGPRPAVESMGGQTRLEIGQGRLRGVSLLRGTLERLASFAEAAILVGAIRGGSTLQRFYGDEFQSITGSFDVGGGRARTEDLRLVYRNYTADLRGTFGLADGALDMTGKLTIGEEVDTALAGATPDAAAAEAPPPARQKVIPLARVRGTASAPRIDLSPEAVVAFASSFAVSRRREKVERKIDERLGEGAGREILDTLEGILGGGRKRESPQQ